MNFSFKDYQALLKNNVFNCPKGFQPYIPVDRVRYNCLEQLHKDKKNSYDSAFRQLNRRVGNNYYWEVYPAQSRSLDYAQTAFPAYKFILPEILTDDWLAIVDWHKFQRDHALHQPLTAYITLKLLGFGNSKKAFQINGKSLLDMCIDTVLEWKGTVYLRDYLKETGLLNFDDSDIWFGKEHVGREMWKTLFVETAYLSALFHDMGYPWQYINILAGKLEYIDGQKETPTQNADHILKLFGERLFFCPFNGYRLFDRNKPVNWHDDIRHLVSKSFYETHGFPGAIGFLYFNDVLRDYPAQKNHAIRQFCIEWAAMGIMMHDMGKIYWGKDKTKTPPGNRQLKLNFSVDPLSCIIALADVLEDFQRPVASFSNTKNTSTAKYNISCKETVLEFADGHLNITYKMRNDDDVRQKLAYMRGEETEYFDDDFGYLDLSPLGVERVTMIAERY